MKQQKEGFISKWWRRFKTVTYLIAIWAVCFSIITLINLRVGYEYDDGLVFSTPAFRAAGNISPELNSQTYWNTVNGSWKFERLKPVPYLTAWVFKSLGFKVDILCRRNPDGADNLVQNWSGLANEFYFAADENQVYEYLEKHPFILYFASSDAGIIQAVKAGVRAVRISKSSKSILPAESHPGQFHERILPLSEF